MLFHQIGERITLIISIAWYFTTKSGTVQNRPKVVDSFFGYSSCIARGFLKTVNWNLNGALNPMESGIFKRWYPDLDMKAEAIPLAA